MNEPTMLGLDLQVLLILFVVAFEAAVSVYPTITYDVTEEDPPGKVVGNVLISSKLQTRYNVDVLRTLRFKFLSSSGYQSYFQLSEETGRLTTAKKLDREVLCPPKSAVESLECVIQLEVAVTPNNFLQIFKVMIQVIDINDHAPKFINDTVIRRIPEDVAIGTTFLIPEATDADFGRNGIREYVLDPAESNGLFKLKVEHDADGSAEVKLIVSGRLDRETKERYRLKVTAYDGGTPPKSGSMFVDVTVLDANDCSPRFLEPAYQISIAENVANGTSVGVVKAVDDDVGDNAKIVYSFSRNTQMLFGNTFKIIPETGVIRVVGPVDFESHDKYSLGIVAFDRGTNPLSGQCKVMVLVSDVNDNPPRITVNSMTSSGLAEVAENTDPGAFVSHLAVNDPDSGDGGKWDCSLTGNGFALDRMFESHEFKLVTSQKLDRELQSTYVATLTCKDRGQPALTSARNITIRVTDVNDEAPRFSQASYLAAMQENNELGDLVGQVNATDPDEGKNAQLSFKISFRDQSNTKPLPVRIDAKTGSIYATEVFDREMKDRYEFSVTASDGGLPVRTATVAFYLQIGDVNDEPPRFPSDIYTFGTYENQPEGTEIGLVVASDKDSPPFNQISYALNGSTDTFSIDSASGKITAIRSLDRERIGEYKFPVIARNLGFALSTSTLVTVIVADKNDNAPVITFPSAKNNSVQISSKSRLGDLVATVEASDTDIGSNAILRYSITRGDDFGMFDMNPVNGAILVRGDLDKIADTTVVLSVHVRDDGSPRLTASSVLYVLVNSSAPIPPVAAFSTTFSFTAPSLLIVAGVSFLITILGIVILVLALYRRRKRRIIESSNRKQEALKDFYMKDASSSSPRYDKKDGNATLLDKSNLLRAADSDEHRDPSKPVKKINGEKELLFAKEKFSSKTTTLPAQRSLNTDHAADHQIICQNFRSPNKILNNFDFQYFTSPSNLSRCRPPPAPPRAPEAPSSPRLDSSTGGGEYYQDSTCSTLLDVNRLQQMLRDNQTLASCCRQRNDPSQISGSSNGSSALSQFSDLGAISDPGSMTTDSGRGQSDDGGDGGSITPSTYASIKSAGHPSFPRLAPRTISLIDSSHHRPSQSGAAPTHACQYCPPTPIATAGKWQFGLQRPRIICESPIPLATVHHPSTDGGKNSRNDIHRLNVCKNATQTKTTWSGIGRGDVGSGRGDVEDPDWIKENNLGTCEVPDGNLSDGASTTSGSYVMEKYLSILESENQDQLYGTTSENGVTEV